MLAKKGRRHLGFGDSLELLPREMSNLLCNNDDSEDEDIDDFNENGNYKLQNTKITCDKNVIITMVIVMIMIWRMID